jgi:class 3 adenylate cyclase
MSGLPSGTVTFVFSDIEGSTSLLKVLGDRYGDVLSDHRRLMRECFTGRGGVEIDTQGDAFFFAFPRAKDAVSAAVEAQRLHATHAWTDGQTVRVRMGLHTGEPAVGSEGYLGIDVVRAARLCTVGRGGQVLLSETTRALVGGSLPEGVSVHTLGERLLKDIDEPERIFELDIEGAAATPEAEVTPGPPEPPSRPTPPSPQGSPITPDFGARLAERIQEHVRRTVEEPLERMFSVEALADRASEHPETIIEKLDSEDGSPGAAPAAQQGERKGTPH